MAMLSAANAEELADLRVWIKDHYGRIVNPATDQPFSIAAMTVAEGWLQALIEQTTTYPASAPVPVMVEPVLKAAIDDWSEVLASHDEGFMSWVQ